MNKRRVKFYDIKSLIHFDFPYLNEPNDGIADEVNLEEWEKIGSISMKGSPKFGYRCAYFNSNTSYIKANNKFKFWNINTNKKYTISFFMKINSAQNNTIFEFVDNLKIGINDSAQITVYSDILNINNITSTITFPYEEWVFISIQFINNKLLIFINEDKAIEIRIPIIALIINEIRVGQYIGYIDEFLFRTSSTGTSTIPLKQYIGKAILENKKFGTGTIFNEIITNQCTINSYSLINEIISEDTISTNNWSNGIYGAPEIDQEVLIHFTAKKGSNEEYLGYYFFDNIKEINEDNPNIITLYNKHNITESILKKYYIQILTIPNYDSLTISTGAKILPISWNGTYGGGIVAFKCLNNCTINGSIITHGYGCVRNDYQQVRNSNLINKFIFSQGGGIFISVGKKITIDKNARLGATWSGTGEGSYGRAGYGGGNQIGGGKGGASWNGGYGGSVGYDGGYGNSGGGGGGCGGNGGNHPHSYLSSTGNIYRDYAGGGGGGGQGNSGGKGGSYDPPRQIEGNYYDSTSYDGYNGTINGGNGGSGYNKNGSTWNNDYRGGGGGGAPGGNGGSSYTYTQKSSRYVRGGIAGASIIIIANNSSIDVKSLSTGGEPGQTSYTYVYQEPYKAKEQYIHCYQKHHSGGVVWYTPHYKTRTVTKYRDVSETYYGGEGGSGGTGFCYLGINKYLKG